MGRLHSDPPAVTAFAPAKLNLTLHVLGRRGDGFHEIRSLVVGVGLWDDLVFTTRAQAGWELVCEPPSFPTPRNPPLASGGWGGVELPVDNRNLVARAIESLAAVCSPPCGINVRLVKRIPIGGGLGGGSSDAAVSLMAVNQLWGLGFKDRGLAEMGATLGSDVPLFFSLPAAQISGRGEIVARTTTVWHGWFVLVHTGLNVATSRVYAAWRAEDRKGDEDAAQRVMEARTADELAAAAYNGLEWAIVRVYPEMGEWLEAVQRVVPRAVRITGAGGTIYVPCDHEGEADELMTRIRTKVAEATGNAPKTPLWIGKAQSHVVPRIQHH